MPFSVMDVLSPQRHHRHHLSQRFNVNHIQVQHIQVLLDSCILLITCWSRSGQHPYPIIDLKHATLKQCCVNVDRQHKINIISGLLLLTTELAPRIYSNSYYIFLLALIYFHFCCSRGR